MPLLGGRATTWTARSCATGSTSTQRVARVANDPAIVGTSLGGMYLGEQVQEFFV